MNSLPGRGRTIATASVVVATALCVLISVVRANGELLGGGIIVLLVLWFAYDIWLRRYGGHSTARQWPNSVISFGAAFGVTSTAYFGTDLAIDIRGANVNTTIDGVATMISVVILALAAGVELYRRERDRTRAVTG
ncbi:hypothetical protein [Labedaea rhizosphaerae]|uniref:Uncharacterized protein n=1 Tax=Labedaea rhizosphaerae TaxID=598644 RepID=A0A4V3D017_LABRH|nr:hypothetical protein [Labedaea rhizosphaerae]TDQ04065.1 hypothetical protein EV186_1015 [Labedaea rhizosphaerae]